MTVLPTNVSGLISRNVSLLRLFMSMKKRCCLSTSTSTMFVKRRFMISASSRISTIPLEKLGNIESSITSSTSEHVGKKHQKQQHQNEQHDIVRGIDRGHHDSNLSAESFFQEGEFVITIDNKQRRKLSRLNTTKTLRTPVGDLKHTDIIGKPVGSIFRTSVNVLLKVFRPSLEEYVDLMPRGPAVIQPKDAAAMVMLMDVAQGNTVLEAGTGSGGLTLFLSRAVGVSGSVVTIDQREDHSSKSISNFSAWIASKSMTGRTCCYDNVIFEVGNVSDHMTIRSADPASIDSVALDMPEPTLVLHSIVPLLRPGRPLVIYLPNLTQVLSLVSFVHNSKDLDLIHDRTVEVDHRKWDIGPSSMSASDPSLYRCRPHHDQPTFTGLLVVFRKYERSPGKAIDVEVAPVETCE